MYIVFHGALSAEVLVSLTQTWKPLVLITLIFHNSTDYLSLKNKFNWSVSILAKCPPKSQAGPPNVVLVLKCRTHETPIFKLLEKSGAALWLDGPTAILE